MNLRAMSATERRATFALAGIFALRMLGLFMVLPVFALHADTLIGVTPALVGVAVSAYGLSQGLLQFLCGWLSDRWGRKPVIAVGLLLFAAGSVIAALADHIAVMIAGRFLQGAGAVAAVAMALLADLTREDQRTKAMAIVGITIGASFVAAFAIGPVLAGAIGVRGLFWLTAVLAVASIVILFRRVPEPAPAARGAVAAAPTQPYPRELLRLNVGIFLLHMLLTGMFTVLPFVLRDAVGLPDSRHWTIYVPVLLAAIAMALPLFYLGERRGLMKPAFLAAIAAVATAFLLLGTAAPGAFAVGLGLWLFFSGFNFLEAVLPSLVSRMAPAARRGAAMGTYTTTQFFGAFAGGPLAGLLFQTHGPQAVFLGGAAVAAAWLVLAALMPRPRQLTLYNLPIAPARGAEAAALVGRLRAVRGVAEAAVEDGDDVAVLKVDRRELDEAALRTFARP